MAFNNPENQARKLVLIESDDSNEAEQQVQYLDYDQYNQYEQCDQLNQLDLFDQLDQESYGGDEWKINMIDPNEIVYAKKPTVKVIGNYFICHTLGEGSYSKVREALHRDTLQRAAVKIMSQQRLKKIPNGLKNAEREIRLMRTLNHDNVIKLLDVFRRDDSNPKLYLFLEYGVIGLQKLLDDSPSYRLPVWQAHNYFHQLLNGLEYLHSKRIIHNDIKPGNLLLNAQETVKIIDFGVSMQLDLFEDNDYCDNSQGSPAFQPPEVVLGNRPFHGFKIDVWAAGVCLFNFIFGKYPFEGENIYILFDKIAYDPLVILPIPNPHYSDSYESLVDLLTGMLNKNVDERISVTEAKNHDWMQRKHDRYEPKVGIILRGTMRSELLSELISTVPKYLDEEPTIAKETTKLFYSKFDKQTRRSELIEPTVNDQKLSELHNNYWSSKFTFNQSRSISEPNVHHNQRGAGRWRKQMGRWVWESMVNTLNRFQLY